MMRIAAVAVSAMLLAGAAMAQGTNIAFGGLKHDTSQPVEVASDNLQIDQANGSASFSGNVLITQGELRLSAGTVNVVYAPGSVGQISELRATGGVTLVNGTEAAEAREAVYSIDKGTVVMTGNVILTQGQNALSSDTLTIDLNSGTGNLSGRVRTVFQTGNN